MTKKVYIGFLPTFWFDAQRWWKEKVLLCRFLSLSWHIFKQKKFLIWKQTSLLIDVNILLEEIWIWKISTIFLTFMNILTYETYSKTTQTKNYTSSFKRIFSNFYFSVHSMMGMTRKFAHFFFRNFRLKFIKAEDSLCLSN